MYKINVKSFTINTYRKTPELFRIHRNTTSHSYDIAYREKVIEMIRRQLPKLDLAGFGMRRVGGSDWHHSTTRTRMSSGNDFRSQIVLSPESSGMRLILTGNRWLNNYPTAIIGIAQYSYIYPGLCRPRAFIVCTDLCSNYNSLTTTSE